MTHYNVVLMKPDGYPYSLGIWDTARLLHHSFQSLGLPTSVGINTLNRNYLNIVLGYHMLPSPKMLEGHDCIIFQLEQFSDKDRWKEKWLGILQHAREVWDFSPENIAFMKSKGIDKVKLLTYGYHQALRTIKRAAPDTDVLFYGVNGGRRLPILDELARRCRTKVFFGVYGKERDDQIARSRIVLNMHIYDAGIMEQPRVSYLLNNGICVVAEESPHNPFEGMIAAVPYNKLVDECMRYIADAPAREALARRGHELFRQRPMVDNLRAVLGLAR